MLKSINELPLVAFHLLERYAVFLRLLGSLNSRSCTVLQVPQHSTHWYQKCVVQTLYEAESLTDLLRALLTSELEELFRDAPLAPNATAHASIREAYARATGKASPAATTTNNNRRMPNKDDDCPICYEGMYGIKADMLSWCQTCGNSIHKECFQQCELIPIFLALTH